MATTLNADASVLCSCDPQTTSWRRRVLSRVRPPLRGRAPQPVFTDPDWASTQPARPWSCPSSAPPSRGPCPAAPLCSPRVRAHTPWISSRCVPVWSPRWPAETSRVPGLAATWMSVGFLGPILGVHVRSDFLSLPLRYLCSSRVNGSMEDVRLRRQIKSFFLPNFTQSDRLQPVEADPGSGICPVKEANKRRSRLLLKIPSVYYRLMKCHLPA